jgi:endonuclease-3
MACLPRAEWKTFADRLIWHGRRVCFAKKPACEQCTLAPLCPSAEVPGSGTPKTKASAKTKTKAKATAKATPARAAKPRR